MIQVTTIRWLRRQALTALGCSLVVAVSIALAGSGRATGVANTPLAAMREAAQEAAEVEPEPTKATHKLPTPAMKLGNDALRAAIKEAVHAEAESAAQTGTLAHSDNPRAASSGTGNAASDRQGPSEMGQLHSNAMSVQEAKRGTAIQSQHQGGEGTPANAAAAENISKSLAGTGGKR